jgi:hypothetical protein
MTKKQLALILAAVLVAGTYLLLDSRASSAPVGVVHRVLRTREPRLRGPMFFAGQRPNANIATDGSAPPPRRMGFWGAGGAGLTRRERRAAAAAAQQASTRPADPPLLFEFDRKLAFDSIKVYPMSELESQLEYPHPVWQIVAHTNPVPTKGFTYGSDPSVLGMRLAVEEIGPEPLEPGVKYRLLAQSGRIKVQHDFVGPDTKR